MGQAWWRKIQNVGLSTDYTTETEIGKWLKLYFGLPFLKPQDVQPCFDKIVAVKPKHTRSVQAFTNYISKTYIMPQSKYPPSINFIFSSIPQLAVFTSSTGLTFAVFTSFKTRKVKVVRGFYIAFPAFNEGISGICTRPDAHRTRAFSDKP